jgi:putative membrane protein insertion efficiency factor
MTYKPSFMNSLAKLLDKAARMVAIAAIHLYRALVSPSVGILRFLPFYPRATCMFYPTCSEYSIQCFTKYSFLIALHKTATRVGRCRPGNEPGVDLP